MRENGVNHDPGFQYRVHGSKQDASFQVIILGCSGGPREDTATGLLVRAPQSKWRKSSLIAVDAGAHLASIIRVLEQDMPMNSVEVPPKDYRRVLDHGPFAGIEFPHVSAKANALYILRELLHSFLITHPHLDHLSAMGINTPALEYGREAKAIVALPPTIEAIKNHIFNDAIWPNLSDEGHGVGFVTYRRLIEGGNPRLGSGEARGYVNVCDGLATKCWAVTHGKCHRRSHSMSHQRGDSFGFGQAEGYNFPGRRLSRMSEDHGYVPAYHPQYGQPPGIYPPASVVGQVMPSLSPAVDRDHLFEPVSSSAFFIRNDSTGQEILVFGDIEPDSVSMSPGNATVWDDAAPKIASGLLKAIFIECSYDDSVRDADLYGHLCPRHLVAELVVLARRVMSARTRDISQETAIEVERHEQYSSHDLQSMDPPTPTDMRRKRKWENNGDGFATVDGQSPTYVGTTSPQTHQTKIPGPHTSPNLAQYTRTRRKTEHEPGVGIDGYLSDGRPSTPRPNTVRASHAPISTIPEGVIAAHASLPNQPPKLPAPLAGLTVHIIHIKDSLADGPTQGETIEGQLRKAATAAGLGCDFDITSCGESIWI